MAIGIALVLIFVLYLIDKHNRWRQAFKLTVGLFVLGIVAVSGFFGWQKYEGWQEARQEARQEAEYKAEQAKRAAQKQDEQAKTCKDWEDEHPIGSPLDKVYTEQGGLIEKHTNKHFWVLDPPQGCEGPLETDYNTRNLWVLVPTNPSKPKPKLKTESQPESQPNCQVVVCSDWALVVIDFTSIVKRCVFGVGPSACGSFASTADTYTAELRKGDRVQILSGKVRASDGDDIYEVKFQEWTGWMYASDLRPEEGREK